MVKINFLQGSNRLGKSSPQRHILITSLTDYQKNILSVLAGNKRVLNGSRFQIGVMFFFHELTHL